ncbi:hypothetical protein [Sandaracinus amylolyticus]|uniref:hypothetical protein n=1 Tax=Sandaracinus amylolyticus TaxID=927083 RepID=UPI001F22428F|nr:hypothetical protein [Sandaracinus amylolyticus]UJR78863.1 Hypothetical protein I5071_8960 [Sandaracinus amylolyticus]
MGLRVVVVAKAGALRDRVCDALQARGVETCGDLDAAMASGPIDAVIAELDPSPRKSGLGILLAASERAPRARRVLLVEGRASIADAAFASGVADRVLLGYVPPRIEAIAEWLTSTCEHGPRRIPALS